jgi:hypothetical protein
MVSAKGRTSMPMNSSGISRKYSGCGQPVRPGSSSAGPWAPAAMMDTNVMTARSAVTLKLAVAVEPPCIRPF